MSLAIETINLTRRYGGLLALDRLNLHVTEGSIYGFIGPNGAGKTTTLRMLAGLLEPTSGEIRVLGQAVQAGGSHLRRLIGYMPDVLGVYDDLRVWEYLDFFAQCYGIETARRRRAVDELLNLVDLSSKRQTFVQNLSRGMQQRLGLAHAMVHNPAVLILDEPASGLDPRARVELRELIRTLSEMGKTILLSSHILSELAELCTEIGIIDGGRLIVSGPVAAVRRELTSDHALHIRVLGDPEAAITVLRTLPARPDLPTVRQVAPDTSDPRRLRVELTASSEEQEAALLAFLLAHGVLVSDYSFQAENLEELFLRVTANGG